MMIPKVKAFFDEATFTVTYIVYDDVDGHCAVIDSVLDYDPRSGRRRVADGPDGVRHHRAALGGHPSLD